MFVIFLRHSRILYSGRQKALNAFKGNKFPTRNKKIDYHDLLQKALTPESPTKILQEDMLPFGSTQGKGIKKLLQ